MKHNKLIALFLALILALAVLPMVSMKTAAAETVTYTKITSTPSDWSGTYLIVYDTYVFNGTDSGANNYIALESTTDTISDSNGTYTDGEVVIAQMEGGYSLKSSKQNKYMAGLTADSNGTNFSTDAVVTSFEMSGDTVKITSNSKLYAFNSTSTQLRFRFFKSGTVGGGTGTYKFPSLYKKSTSVGSGYTVTYKANADTGAAKYAVSDVQSGSYTLLAPADCGFTAPAGSTFGGWAVAGETGEPLAAGASYTITGDTTFIAKWFSTYTKVTDMSPADATEAQSTGYFQNGCEYLLVLEDNEIAFVGTSNDAGNSVAVTINNNNGVETITGDYTANEITIAQLDAGGYSLKNHNNKYLKNGSNATISFTDAAQAHDISIGGTELRATIKDKNTNKWICYNSSSSGYIRYYNTNSNQLVALYKKVGGSYVTPPAPVTTYTVTYQSGEGTGDDYPVDSITAGTEITLLTPGTCGFTAPLNKKFKEWKQGSDAYAAGAKYTVNGNVTFVAQWEEIPAPITKKYQLVTDASSLKDGDKIILVGIHDDGSTSYAYAMSYQKPNNRHAVSVTINAKNQIEVLVAQDVSDTTSAYELVIGSDNGARTFYDALNNGYLYTASSTNNYLKTQTTVNDKARFTLYNSSAATTEGIAGDGTVFPVAKDSSTNRNHMRMNYNGGSPMFSCYASGTNYDPIYIFTELKPMFVGQQMIVTGEIGVAFNINLPEIDGVNYADSYMTFSVPHGSQPAQVNYAKATPLSADRYSFVAGITSIQMAEPVTATFHYQQSGTWKAVDKTFTPQNYFAAYFELQGTTEKEQRFVKAFKNFGYYVQLFLQDVNPWKFVGAPGTSETDKQYIQMSAPYGKDDKIGFTPTSAASDADAGALRDALESYKFDKDDAVKNIMDVTYSLTLDTVTSINVDFSAKSTYTGTPTFTVTCGTSAVDATVSGSGPWTVKIPNICAQDLDKMYTITVKEGDTTVGTVQVSGLSYVRGMLIAAPNQPATGNKTAAEVKADWQNAAAAIYTYWTYAHALKYA